MLLYFSLTAFLPFITILTSFHFMTYTYDSSFVIYIIFLYLIRATYVQCTLLTDYDAVHEAVSLIMIPEKLPSSLE
jgi:hypothetical protein